jgi:hypothetical protein
VVLYRVIRPPFQCLRDLSPPIPQQHMEQVEDPFLFNSPSFFNNVRAKVVVPPLATLLTDAAWKMFCDLGPFLGSVEFHELPDCLVLFIRPGASFNCFGCFSTSFGVNVKRSSSIFGLHLNILNFITYKNERTG